MTTIAEFSDQPRYTIKNVSAMTGIQPVTLRAWERRYEALSPSRSGNRYRLYSDRDVAVLRWLNSRLQSGVSISTAVKELRQMTEQGQWPEAVAAEVHGERFEFDEDRRSRRRRLGRRMRRVRRRLHDPPRGAGATAEQQRGGDRDHQFFLRLGPCFINAGHIAGRLGRRHPFLLRESIRGRAH